MNAMVSTTSPSGVRRHLRQLTPTGPGAVAVLPVILRLLAIQGGCPPQQRGCGLPDVEYSLP